MHQACACARFAVEPFADFRIDFRTGTNRLQRHFAIEHRVAGAIDRSHGPHADLIENLVLT